MIWPKRLYGGVRYPLDRPSMRNVERIDAGASRMVVEMMRHGIYLDCGYLREFASYLKGEEDRITKEVNEMTGFRTNLGSLDQLAELLFRRLHIKPRFNLKLTPTGKREILDDGVLESIKDLHPVVPKVQEFQECFKLRTSFAETLPNFIDQYSRVHGDIKQTRVVTGRFAMTGPNLMGQPTRSDLGKRIRKAFKAPPGRLLIGFDMSQLQMRIAAHLSGCLNMIETFLSGGDIHSQTASMMFRLPIDKLDKQLHRYPAKRAGFGVLFLITGAGLKEQFHAEVDPTWDTRRRQEHFDYWTEDRCDEVIALWYKANSEIKDWQGEEITQGRRFGMVWDDFGRVRLTPGIRSSHRHIKMDAERECGNSPIVMFESAYMKLGMAEVQDIIDDRGWDLMPLAVIHDALLFESGDKGPEYLKEIQSVFANAVPMDVPMLSDGGVTEESWADL